MDVSPGSPGRMAIALLVIALLAASSLVTMEPSRFRQLVWILLAFFAFRVVLGHFGRARSR